MVPRPLEPPARYGSQPVPLPVVLALLYAGAMSLLLLWLVQTWPTPSRASFLATAAWVDSGGAEAFRRVYRGTHFLLVGYLWITARGLGGRGVADRWWLAGAALLILAVHRALDAALSALPRAHLLPWPMSP